MGRTTGGRWVVWGRVTGFSALLVLGGCSLVFSAGDYQGGENADDAGVHDAGRDSGDADAMQSPDLNVVIKRDERAVWNLTTGRLTHGGGEDDEIIPPVIEAQDDGAPELAVFSLDSLVMEEGAKLEFELGDGGSRAVFLSVRGDVVIDGRIDVSAKGQVGGPGGASSDTDGSPSDVWPLNGRAGLYQSDTGAVVALSGGGGGSNGGVGGPGGDGTATGTVLNKHAMRLGGVAGAASVSMTEWTTSLFGGGAGGPTVCKGEWEARGGGGGGAFRIASKTSINIQSHAVILASGAGGESRDKAESLGRCIDGATAGGAGGGAGGTILLEAPRVAVSGGVFANGGGGAGGDARQAGPESGADGKAAISAAAGTQGHASDDGKFESGDGGAGGARANPNGGAGENASAVTMDLEPVFPAASGGGGGGGVGRIVVRTMDGTLAAGGTFSPDVVVEDL